MPPSIPPSPAPSKEPPDKASGDIRAPLNPRLDLGTSLPANHNLYQPPASPTVRPPFAPFFTLITDTTRGTTHHPKNIHYIFSDDDPSLLTEACLQTLNPPLSTSSSFTRSQQQQHRRAPSTDDASSSSTSRSLSSSTNSPPQNLNSSQQPHILLLDVSPSGTAIQSAHSLSPSWQILSTALTPAPTWAAEESPSDVPGDPSNPASGFMLKISGTDGSLAEDNAGADVGLGLGKNLAGKGTNTMPVAKMPTEADFAGLVRDFEARMKVLRTIVETGVGLDLDGDELDVEEGGEIRAETIPEAVEEEEEEYSTTTAMARGDV